MIDRRFLYCSLFTLLVLIVAFAGLFSPTAILPRLDHQRSSRKTSSHWTSPQPGRLLWAKKSALPVTSTRVSPGGRRSMPKVLRSLPRSIGPTNRVSSATRPGSRKRRASKVSKLHLPWSEPLARLATGQAASMRRPPNNLRARSSRTHRRNMSAAAFTGSNPRTCALAAILPKVTRSIPTTSRKRRSRRVRRRSRDA